MTHEQLAILGAGAALLGLIASGLAVYAVILARTTLAAIRVLTAPRTQPPAPRHLARERRETDQGPPDGVEERRRHRAPDDTRARRRDADDPRWQVAGDRTEPQPAVRSRPPMPEETHPATTDMRTLPPPGSIHR